MTNDAYRENRIAADGDRKSQRPHQCQALQNIVPGRNIGDIPQRTCFVIEHKIPDPEGEGFHVCATVFLS